MKTSFPKNKIKVLLLENIHPRAREIFTAEGYPVEVLPRALDPKELSEKLKGVFVLGIRSKTRVERQILAKASKLIAAGAFCIGTNQINNVILTPHIGGSTEEAQQNIAQFTASRIIEFINNGDTMGSVNFPNLQLPPLQSAHRLIHIHENVPGMLAQINSILALHKINIVGQYLKTNEEIGYVITDINRQYDKQVLAELKCVPKTIRFRVLY